MFVIISTTCCQATERWKYLTANGRWKKTVPGRFFRCCGRAFQLPSSAWSWSRTALCSVYSATGPSTSADMHALCDSIKSVQKGRYWFKKKKLYTIYWKVPNKLVHGNKKLNNGATNILRTTLSCFGVFCTFSASRSTLSATLLRDTLTSVFCCRVSMSNIGTLASPTANAHRQAL